jgi:hypothetical protein
MVANRQDFDRFERRLRAGRMAAPIAALAVLLGLGAAGAFYYRYSYSAQQAASATTEREPNNDPEHANPIALGAAMSGKIGAPLSDTESDRDVFVLDVPEPTSLSLELSGVQDMNLVMEVFQAEAVAAGGATRLAPLLVLDDAPTGKGERVDALEVQKGPLYVRISERHYFTEAARPPRETTKNEYHLIITQTTAPGQMEVEPDDAYADAKPLGSGKAIFGFTGANVPYERAYVNQSPPLSTGDFLIADQETDGRHEHAVVVVPPDQGGLLVTDAAELDAWRKADAEGRDVKLPRAVRVQGKAEVIPLKQSTHGVRIQPTDETAPGSLYAVAFLTPAADGMAGVLDLAKSLASSGRAKASVEALQAAKEIYPHSPQLGELQSMLDATRVAKDGP